MPKLSELFGTAGTANLTPAEISQQIEPEEVAVDAGAGSSDAWTGSLDDALEDIHDEVKDVDSGILLFENALI